MIRLVGNYRDRTVLINGAYALNSADCRCGVSYDNILFHLSSSLSFLKNYRLVGTALDAGGIAVVVLHTKVALADNL